MNYDRSDARHGSGIGYAPVGADSRDDLDGAEAPSFGAHGPAGISPALLFSAKAVKEAALDRNVANPFSGGQLGSPAMTYLSETRTGMEPIELSPIDGGMVDPIRRGDNASRRPFSRFLFQTSKWWDELVGDFSHKDRVLAGSDNNGPKASMPRGRMSPMDEYRLLGDGSHA